MLCTTHIFQKNAPARSDRDYRTDPLRSLPIEAAHGSQGVFEQAAGRRTAAAARLIKLHASHVPFNNSNTSCEQIWRRPGKKESTLRCSLLYRSMGHRQYRVSLASILRTISSHFLVCEASHKLQCCHVLVIFFSSSISVGKSCGLFAIKSSCSLSLSCTLKLFEFISSL